MDNNTKNPLVSILMCTYNDEDYIGEAIESILKQSYKNIEFIIVNDGSTDDTKTIIHNFASSKIRYIENIKNQGQEFSKNLGISKAKGKYIAYMDGDDISELERIATQVEFMEKNMDIGLCSTRLAFFGQRNGELLTVETDENIRLQALFSTPMPHPTWMIRRDILTKHSIEYEQGFLAAEDYCFILKLLEKTKAYCIQKALYRYRWHGKNISIEKKDLQKENTLKISQIAFRKLLNVHLPRDEHSFIHSKLNAYKLTIEEIDKIHFILYEKLKSSDSELVKPFKKFYSEKLMWSYNFESPKGFITLFSFFRTKPWQNLPFKVYYQKYLLIIAKCIYRNFVK
ncbi:MAG: glycosyltransferase family A protein [Chitinophagales bacterium]